MNQELIEGSLIKKAHERLVEILQPGDLAVDATLGNGHDTLFLADCLGIEGCVIGFDVQQGAIDSTRERLLSAGVSSSCFQLYLESHDQISKRVADGDAAAVVFNLGYLPGADKSLITQVGTTLEALSQALVSLRRGGLLSVMCYPGHDGGDVEAREVTQWFENLGAKVNEVSLVKRAGSAETSPFLLVAVKS